VATGTAPEVWFERGALLRLPDPRIRPVAGACFWIRPRVAEPSFGTGSEARRAAARGWIEHLGGDASGRRGFEAGVRQSQSTSPAGRLGGKVAGPSDRTLRLALLFRRPRHRHASAAPRGDCG